MNAPSDLSAILGRKPSEVPEPQPLPNGIYLAQVESVGQPEQRGQNKNWAVDFNCKLLQATDVDQSLLRPDDLPRTRRLTKWITEGSAYHFGKFLTETLGIEESGRTMLEMIPEARGRMFKVEVKQEPYQDRRTGEQVMGNNFGKEYHVDAEIS